MAIRSKLKFESILRFWAKVQKGLGCWTWTAALNESGYGVFGVGKQTDKAHRIAYQLERGPIPDGLFVLHRCDNRLCVNPDHLFLGTNADNVRDMIAKKRNSPPPPMAGHNRIELSKSCLNKLGILPDYILGEQYGVSKKTIARNRRIRGIPSFAATTGNTGKFYRGMSHPRWT